MTDRDADDGEKLLTITRALSVPVVALVIAALLLLIRLLAPEGPPNSPTTLTEAIFSYRLQRGIRTISITFGLSCAPGILIGSLGGYLIAKNSLLSGVTIALLRIAQWIPFVTWWVVVQQIFVTLGQQAGQFFFVWTLAIPAVALGCAHQSLCLEQYSACGWRVVLAETVRVGVNRGLFISLLMSLSIWLDPWVVYAGATDTLRHYLALSMLALFLFLVQCVYRSSLTHTRSSHRDIFRQSLTYAPSFSFWITVDGALLTIPVLWHLFHEMGYVVPAPMAVLNAAVQLIMGSKLWIDLGASFLSIAVGLTIVTLTSLILSSMLDQQKWISRLVLSVLSLTYVIPLVALPAWHGRLLSMNQSPRFFVWYVACVACLSFHPVMESLWTLRTEPALFKILIAIEQALPYSFAAMLYGEMMSGIVGIGFATVVAAGTNQPDMSLALVLITILLLTVLSTTLRRLAARSIQAG